jgi:hypothetical protein
MTFHLEIRVTRVKQITRHADGPAGIRNYPARRRIPAGPANVCAAKTLTARPSRMAAAAAREAESMCAVAKYVLAGTLATLSLVPGAEAQIRNRQSAFEWQTFVVPEFGTTVEYPARIFAVPDGKAE